MHADPLATPGQGEPAPAFTLLTIALGTPPQASQATHIVLLVDQFPPVLGGGERVVLRTAALLRSAGFRVSIVTFAIECPGELLRAAGCPVYLLPITGVFQPAALRAAWQFGRFLRRERVRIVQTYFESSNLFGGLVTKLLSRSKLVWNFRDMGILRKKKHRTAYRLLRRLPDHVIAVAQSVRQHAIDVDGIAPERVSVMYNSVDLPQPESVVTRDKHKAPLIVTVGNIRPVKGHDILIEAAAQVLQQIPSAQFQVAGEVLDTAFHRDMQERLRVLGISSDVTFLGKVDDPSNLLRQAALFVLPSRSEGFSNAIIEAMAASLPVVATSVGGNAEAVLDGVTGLIVPPENADALAQAMVCLLNDPEKATAMGCASCLRAESLFTAQAMLEQLRSLYRTLLDA